MNYHSQVKSIFEQAILEDVGDGDHSSLSCIPKSTNGTAKLIVKDNGIIAGIEEAKIIIQLIDSELQMETFKKDGDSVSFGEIAFLLNGPAQSILKAERLILNTMQRMSGIASLTQTYVEKIKDLNTKILDTRKTTPNFRIIEKKAVVLGGGYNHRFGLYDMIMLKDNHVDFSGGITNAIQKAHEYRLKHKPELKIEIETRNLEEVKEVLQVGLADRIMFDNFSPENLVKGIELVNNSIETEASGGINLTTIRDYALTGVQFISVGALIHSAKNFDLSLKASFE